MEKFISLLCFFVALASNCFSQMTYQQTYTYTYANVPVLNVNTEGNIQIKPVIVNLSMSGQKYVIADSNKMQIFNPDFSLWKSINFPSIPSYEPHFVFYVSENLFRLDNKVDFAVTYQQPASPYDVTMRIMDENGNIIDTVSEGYLMNVYNVDSTARAIVSQKPTAVAYLVYSLPGSIPCDVCANGSPVSPTHVGSISGMNSAFLSDPIPNPSNGQVLINYALPAGTNLAELCLYNSNGQLLKAYNLNVSDKGININASTLASGMYFYNIRANNVDCTAKKMLVIK